MVRILSFLFVLLVSTTVQAQVEKYESEFFSIDYPQFWNATNDDGIINIFPNGEIGAITISGYKDLNLSDEEIKNLMLHTIESPESPEKVNVKKSRNQTEYSYSYEDTAKNGHWTAKILIKNQLLYFVTIFCQTKYWNGNYKKQFLESYNTFKIK